ncbi:MAG TPA: hypothetical protein VIG66_04305 [Noviherbaspirillum sp.]
MHISFTVEEKIMPFFLGPLIAGAVSTLGGAAASKAVQSKTDQNQAAPKTDAHDVDGGRPQKSIEEILKSSGPVETLLKALKAFIEKKDD